MRVKYYSLKTILSKDAQYNIIFGERSNGKTYSVLKYGLERYINNNEQMAIIRRWQDDFTGIVCGSGAVCAEAFEKH